jgi:hypothetical protein
MEQNNMYDKYLQHLIEQDKKRWKLGKAILIALCAFIAIAFIVMCTL